MTEKKKTDKRLIIGVVALAALLAIFAIVFLLFKPKAVQGTKSITIKVVDNYNTTVYNVQTDAKYLRQAMEEADGLEFSGSEGAFGLMVETVNGVTADWNVDASFWGFYVNGDDCKYGIDSQPVEDGDNFEIVYTRVKSE